MSKVQNATKKTLDTQHLRKLQEFQDKESIIARLQKEIEAKTGQLRHYKSNKSNFADDAEFNEYMLLSDHVSDLNNQLSKFENQDEEVDYYMNTGPILFQYYDILENGKDINTIRKPLTTEKSILKYFIKNAPTAEEKVEQLTPNIDRASLLERYMHMTDSNYIKCMENEPRDKCPFCESTDRNIMLNDGMIYCNACNTIEYIIIDHERPSYKDPPKEISYFAYTLWASESCAITFIVKTHG